MYSTLIFSHNEIAMLVEILLLNKSHTCPFHMAVDDPEAKGARSSATMVKTGFIWNNSVPVR